MWKPTTRKQPRFSLLARTSNLLVGSLLVGTTSSLSSSTTTSNVLGARTLGSSDIVVSEACLGTMTWGVQNNQKDAFAQLDYVRSQGVNFIDTAELYPVPLFAKEHRAGATEEILGAYLSQHIRPSQRDELVIATKVAGYFPNSPIASERTVPPITEPQMPDCRLDAASIHQACDASLRRLQTDRIDLFQLHWPDRYVPLFGQTLFDPDQMRDDSIPIEETASALRDLIQEGKIRTIGLSNETPYGVSEWVKATEKLGIRDKLVTIQNSYSLLDRTFDSALAEVCFHYNIGLLPWSVLAGGLLSGKYRKSSPPPSKDSRFIRYPEYMKRWSPVSASKQTLQAVDEYAQIAADAGMSLVELSLAFVRTRRFISKNGSVIIGATTLEQLKENMSPFLRDDDLPLLEEDVLQAINEVHRKCRDPSCSL